MVLMLEICCTKIKGFDVYLNCTISQSKAVLHLTYSLSAKPIQLLDRSLDITEMNTGDKFNQ